MKNTLAFRDTETIKFVKSFIEQDPGVCTISLFTVAINPNHNKFVYVGYFDPCLIFTGKAKTYP